MKISSEIIHTGNDIAMESEHTKRKACLDKIPIRVIELHSKKYKHVQTFKGMLVTSGSTGNVQQWKRNENLLKSTTKTTRQAERIQL